jgi:hypothetical protein
MLEPHAVPSLGITRLGTAPALEPYSHQVAGHTALCKFNDRTVCKPLIETERVFYEHVARSGPLAPFTADYLGVVNVTASASPRKTAAASAASAAAAASAVGASGAKTLQSTASLPASAGSSSGSASGLVSGSDGTGSDGDVLAADEDDAVDESAGDGDEGEVTLTLHPYRIPASPTVLAPRRRGGASGTSGAHPGQAVSPPSRARRSRMSRTGSSSASASGSLATFSSLSSSMSASAAEMATALGSVSRRRRTRRSLSAASLASLTADDAAEMVGTTTTATDDSPFSSPTSPSPFFSPLVPGRAAPLAAPLPLPATPPVLLSAEAELSVTDTSASSLSLASAPWAEGAPTPSSASSITLNGAGGTATSQHNPWNLHLRRMQKLKHGDRTVNQFVLLEDLTYRFRRPCVLDLKMGTRQHGALASPAKIAAQTAKCLATTSATLGVRVCGMQVYRADRGTFVYRDKYYGRSLTPATFPDSIRAYLFDGHTVLTTLIPAFVARLTKLYQIIQSLPNLRFYGSSLLLLYDGHEGRDYLRDVDVRMIDFANVCRVEVDGAAAPATSSASTDATLAGTAGAWAEADDGYLRGLRSLIAVLEDILASSTPAAGPMETDGL